VFSVCNTGQVIVLGILTSKSINASTATTNRTTAATPSLQYVDNNGSYVSDSGRATADDSHYRLYGDTAPYPSSFKTATTTNVSTALPLQLVDVDATTSTSAKPKPLAQRRWPLTVAIVQSAHNHSDGRHPSATTLTVSSAVQYSSAERN